MDKFTKLEGVAAPLKMVNIDTDMIIPKQYLKTIKRTGLGKGLFSEQRYKDDGSRQPRLRPEQAGLPEGQDHRRRRQFRLRLEPRARAVGAARLRHPLRDLDLVRRHFLQQLLQERHPADPRLAGGSGQAVRRRRARLQRDAVDRSGEAGDPRPRRRRGQIRHRRTFRKHCLLNGLDDIGLTMQKGKSIDGYEARAKEAMPWL